MLEAVWAIVLEAFSVHQITPMKQTFTGVVSALAERMRSVRDRSVNWDQIASSVGGLRPALPRYSAAVRWISHLYAIETIYGFFYVSLSLFQYVARVC